MVSDTACNISHGVNLVKNMHLQIISLTCGSHKCASSAVFIGHLAGENQCLQLTFQMHFDITSCFWWYKQQLNRLDRLTYYKVTDGILITKIFAFALPRIWPKPVLSNRLVFMVIPSICFRYRIFTDMPTTLVFASEIKFVSPDKVPTWE